MKSPFWEHVLLQQLQRGQPIELAIADANKAYNASKEVEYVVKYYFFNHPNRTTYVHKNGFSWTRKQKEAKRFATKAAAEKEIHDDYETLCTCCASCEKHVPAAEPHTCPFQSEAAESNFDGGRCVVVKVTK